MINREGVWEMECSIYTISLLFIPSFTMDPLCFFPVKLMLISNCCCLSLGQVRAGIETEYAESHGTPRSCSPTTLAPYLRTRIGCLGVHGSFQWHRTEKREEFGNMFFVTSSLPSQRPTATSHDYMSISAEVAHSNAGTKSSSINAENSVTWRCAIRFTCPRARRSSPSATLSRPQYSCVVFSFLWVNISRPRLINSRSVATSS